MISSLRLFVSLFLVAVLAGSSSAAKTYNVTNLGTLSGNMSWAYGVNNSTVAVGRSQLSIGAPEAFRWESGTISSIGKIHWSDGGKALGISDNGLIVGYAAINTGDNRAAYALPGGNWQNLEDKLPPGSGWVLREAWDVTEDGQIAGWGVHNGSNRAFRMNFNTGAITDLGTHGTQTVSYGKSIANGGGQTLVVGDSGGSGRAFLWSNMIGMKDLGHIGGVGGYTAAHDVSNLVNLGGEYYIGGYVVGWAASGHFGKHHATVIYPLDRDFGGMPETWYEDLDGDGKNDLMRDIGTLASDNWEHSSEALAVNDQGVIVGKSEHDGGAGYHAFVTYGEYNGTEMVLYDLNSLIPSDSGWVLQEATDINNYGQIVGTGLYNGETRGFILTIVPEPSCLMLLSLGLILVGFYARHTQHIRSRD